MPLYTRGSIDTSQTRYYDHDYRNYFSALRQTESDVFGASPEGPATATFRSRTRFFLAFSVPGDVTTITNTTVGTLWEVRRVHGGLVLRVVGTSVEPSNSPATFSGRITTETGTTTYTNVSLDLPSELFLDATCQAAAH